MKKYWKKFVLVIIVLLLVIPLCVAFSVSFRFICTDTSNEWIGFWGGYLGSIIGGMITLYVLRETLKGEKKENKKGREYEECKYIMEKIALFLVAVDDLLRKWNKYFEFVKQGEDNINYYEDALFALSDVNANGMIVTMHLSAMIDDNYYFYSRELLQIYNEIIFSIEKYAEYIQTRDFKDFKIEEFHLEVDHISTSKNNMIEFSHKFFKKNVLDKS